MNTLIAWFLCVGLPLTATAQEYVETNIVRFYDKIPAPPRDVTAAETRLTCMGENLQRSCNADKFYQSMKDSIAVIRQQLQKLNTMLNLPDQNVMQSVDPEEIQKKLASMSQEEQIQYAMKMTRQMGFGPKALTQEPEAVMAAIEAHNELSLQISMEIQNPGSVFQKRMQLVKGREQKHRDIENWYSSEFDKLPQVSFGEAGRGPEPKAEHALKVAALSKHIAVENEYLQSLHKFWPEYLDDAKKKYLPFQQKLEAIDYGEAVENIENKRILVGAQTMLLAPADELLAFSQEASENVVPWLLQKRALEKQNYEAK